MLPVFAYLLNWYTPFVERHARKRVLFCDDVDGRVRLETPEKDVGMSRPYARTRKSDQLGAGGITNQRKCLVQNIPSQSGNVRVPPMSRMTSVDFAGAALLIS